MGEKLLVLATPVALLAAGWVIFYVLKEPPRMDECAQGRDPGVNAYRQGLGTYATVAAAGIAALIARVSRTRRTLFALSICAWLVLVYNADDDVFGWHATFAMLLALFGGEVLLLCSALATFAMRRPRGAQLTYLWTSLLVFVPALAGQVASQGVPGLCMS